LFIESKEFYDIFVYKKDEELRMKRIEQNRLTLEAPTWREQLGTHIRTIEERKRIANQLGVNPLTLTRWVSNESSPHKSSLQKLLSILPSYQAELTELLSDEAHSGSMSKIQSNISLSLYASVLNAYATTHPTLLFWSVSQLILRQALVQLVSEQGAIEIIVAQCMSPTHEGKIHSLREIIRGNSRTRSSNSQRRSSFFGVESLVGAATSTFHKKVVYNFAEERSIYPRILEIGEECSGVAYPILHTNHIAGCLLVSSTEPHYFSPRQQQLIEQYAELFALAFSTEQFYSFEAIELRSMPAEQEQQISIATFRQRVRQAMYNRGTEQPLTLLQAEQQAWQQIEEELREMPLQKG